MYEIRLWLDNFHGYKVHEWVIFSRHSDRTKAIADYKELENTYESEFFNWQLVYISPTGGENILMESEV